MTRVIKEFHFRERWWWLLVILPLAIYIAVDRRAANIIDKDTIEQPQMEVE